MAYQKYKIDEKRHGGRVKGAGENLTDPTRAGRPVTLKYPLERGLPPMKTRYGADGEPLAESWYGKNQADHPASVGVAESNKLTDFDATPDGDDVLDGLARQGFGDHSAENSAVADLERKVSIEGYPASYGMKNRSDPTKAVKIPSSIGGNGPLPRKP